MVKLGICIFAYNRPSHLRRVLISLENYKKKRKNIFVFLDGPKNNKDKIIQKEIKNMVINNQFIKVNFIYRKKNLGLAKSIMNGLNYVSKKFENIIVLEDDCIPRNGFFEYIETILETEKNNLICAYQFPKLEKKNKKFFSIKLRYFVPWGWCVKSSYWIKFKKFLKNEKLYNNINDELVDKIEKKIKNKKNDIWSCNFIKFNILNKTKIYYPSVSLIKNIGFDGTGVNSTITSEFNSSFQKKKIPKKIDIKENQKYLKMHKSVFLNSYKRFF